MITWATAKLVKIILDAEMEPLSIEAMWLIAVVADVLIAASVLVGVVGVIYAAMLVVATV